MRTTVALPFNAGLDRATGSYAVDPSALTDARNVSYREGRWFVRPPLGTPITTLSDVVVAELFVFRAKALMVKVVYNPTSGAVTVYTCNLQGENDTLIGAWDTLASGALSPPRFVGAEAEGLFFLAHDEPDVTKRMTTQTFDGTNLAALQADLDGGGAEDIKFRGVCTHLSYLWGWGFGSDSDPDRPEVLRSSNAGDPAVFTNVNYQLIGVVGEPILSMGLTAGGAVVQKEIETHLHLGTNRLDFDAMLIDDKFGAMTARLAVSVGDTRYFWSAHGPRATTGAASVDLALPLELQAKLPAGLPTGGDVAHGWAEYDQDVRQVLFAFPDFGANRTLMYVLNLRPSPKAPRWSYHVYPKALLCGRVTTVTTETALVSPGTASAVSFAGSQGASSASAVVGWTNNATVGDETVEIWVKPSAGSWTQSRTLPVSGTSQSTTITTGVTGSGSYDVAVRMKRRGNIAAGYESSDPTAWPAGAKASGSVVVIATPVLAAPVWSYPTPNELFTLSWSTPTAGCTVEVQRQITGDPFQPFTSSSYATIQTTAADATGTTDSVSTPQQKYYHGYRVRFAKDGVSGPWSNEVLCWRGPAIQPTGMSVLWNGVGGTSYTVAWVNAGAGELGTDVQELNPSTGGYEEIALSPSPGTSALVSPPLYAHCSVYANVTVHVMIFHLVTISGQTFWGAPVTAQGTGLC